MASTDYSQQMSHGVEAVHADFGADAEGGSQTGDLKGLLNAIVDQISEADRRHSETLQQMQERLTGIGREAKAIKPRVPDQFAAAFERIETGMAELASRITDASSDAPAPSYTAVHVTPVAPPVHAPAIPHANGGYNAQHAAYAEPPKALRSASDGSSNAVSRVHAGVDTFDVIESSPHSGVADPWDRDQAEALAGVYESGAAGFASKPFAPPATASVAALDAAGSAASVVDHNWLEARFADISKRIEDSLNDLNPDQSFFALGQRVDQLEQHFSTLFEGVATRGDVEGVRLIEAHVSELAEHLENAHTQLMRLDAIESHLAGIAGQLGDVHRAALAAGDIPADGMGAPIVSHHAQFDLGSVARTAAEAAAHEFAKFQPRDGAGPETAEIGAMLREFIADSRQGDENTTALLDTLQQAMIRLLDRVDAMELSNLQCAQAQAQIHAQAHTMVHAEPPFAQSPPHVLPATPDLVEHPRYASSSLGSYRANDSEPSASLDAAVAAVATGRIAHLTENEESRAPVAAAAAADVASQRSPDRIRQNFIAEARRAKMRLAEETVTATDAPAIIEPVKPVTQATRNPAKASAAHGTKKQASIGGAQRIKVLALSAMLALGGMWLAKESGLFSGAALVATTPQAETGTSVSKSAETNTPTTANPADAPAGTLMPSTAAPESGAGELKLPDGTRGEIMSDDIIVGSASVPMHGVAVDATKPMTAEDLARARRQQAMANVSGKLGEAAQRQTRGAPTTTTTAAATPAALDLNALADDGQLHDQSRASIAKSGMSQSAPLDLPPATVGPLSLRLAAANGDPSAEFEVGARLAEGKGTDQTFKDAAKWYQRSASKGFAQAQYRIGTLYERGLGLKVDIERAKEWYTRAADQGNVKAMHNLAVLSANQANATPDYATAAQWFQKAADYGLADSQFNLAVLKENGLGVEEDLVAAYKWLALSAKSGDKEAVRRRDILKGKLTTAQLAEGDKQVATWQAKRSDPEINDARKAGEAWKKNPDNGVNG